MEGQNKKEFDGKTLLELATEVNHEEVCKLYEDLMKIFLMSHLLSNSRWLEKFIATVTPT